MILILWVCNLCRVHVILTHILCSTNSTNQNLIILKIFLNISFKIGWRMSSPRRSKWWNIPWENEQCGWKTPSLHVPQDSRLWGQEDHQETCRLHALPSKVGAVVKAFVQFWQYHKYNKHLSPCITLISNLQYQV